MVYRRCSDMLLSLSMLLLFMQLPLSFFAQSKSRITGWHIVVRAAGTSSGYDIRIDQYRDKTNFFFKRLDSLRQRDMEKDLAYIERRAAVTSSTTVDEVTYQIEKLAVIIELFEVSQKDSLSYASTLTDQALKTLLDSVANLPAELLRNNGGIKNEKQIADGYSFHFTRFNGKKKTADFFTAQSSLSSYPLLFRLVTQTLRLYRNKKPDAILTADFTKIY